MTSIEWCELSVPAQEEHLSKLSRLAKMAFPLARNPYVDFGVMVYAGTISNWKLIVADELGRNFLYLAHDDALEVGEEIMRQLAGVGKYWKSEI